ncbi:type III-B CRISPR module RAMP protein Cmr6 [Paenibacillus aceti]|uniref:CRISPR type III-associated protein domain-containing protein n=1 Tax=Paenibacillus aceti TaxID=1820010 RepID=A0ABQ1W882_9BACL|nr:type III-B CRISPR module RAMP protein Cmr6 [Paenibacillus aceti]GGG19962.1 hypothetical protein GCM10010913_47680 [Paenibacillus aceti]
MMTMNRQETLTINLHLALTKLKGASKQSDLLSVIRDKGESKKVFYEKIIKRWHPDQYEWYKHRMKQFYNQVDPKYSRLLIVKNDSPLVIGLGQRSVLETNLTLHPVYDVPYIPGTAIKGAAAHFCHQYLGNEDAGFKRDGVYYRTLFGSEEQAGLIHYYDAFPKNNKNLVELDVMTPHHQGYNDGAKAAPRDDDDPVPVHFLTVSRNTKFCILITCNSEDSQDTKWLDLAQDIIKATVEHVGLGGKTNSGYGKFSFVEGGHADGESSNQC